MTAAAHPSPSVLDYAAVREYLGRYAGLAGELSIVSDRDWSGRRFPTTPDGLAHAAEHVRDLDVDGAAGIYHRGTTVRAGAPRRGRGRAEDSAVWPALRLDVDYGKPGYAPDPATAYTLVCSAGIPAPTEWTSSGHGLYPVWSLTSPAEDSPFLRALVVDLHAAVQAAFVAAGYRIDPGVTDGARVWRIPGTVNRKDDEHPVPCAVMPGAGTGKTVAVSTLRRAVPSAPAQTLASVPTGDPDRDRRFTLESAMAYVAAEALAPLRAAGSGERNHRLNAAACVVGHFVGGGFLDYGQAEQLLLDACPDGWDEPTPVRKATIRSGLRKGMTEPYVMDLGPLELTSTVQPPAQPPTAGGVTAEGAPSATPIDEHGSTEHPGPGEATPAPAWTLDGIADVAAQAAAKVREDKIAWRVEQLDVDAEARARRAARDLPMVAPLDLAAFLSTPKVDYLVPGMLWRCGCARVFGPPGGTKSFLVLDLALSIAAGVPWRGEDLGPAAVVHYVMAEGQAVNAARTVAWMADRDVTAEQLAGTFRPIPSGVQLTPEGIAGYLPLVAAERPALIVLDTKARMMVGSVNRPEDNAVLVRALDMLREASGGCVLLVDHTGLHDLTRAKGDNTVEAAMDTEIRVARGEGGLCTAEVSRDKAAETGAAWTYRIASVGDAAVCEPVFETLELTPAGPVEPMPWQLGEGTWWDLETPVPDAVVTAMAQADKNAGTGKGGSGKSCALDVFRLLRYVGGEDGLTSGEIQVALREGPRQHSRSAVFAGLALLAEAQVTVDGSTAARRRLAPHYVSDSS
jgi:hypothetical protein